MNNHRIKWTVFDYGGVLAEEGFRNGLYAIAEQEGLDREFVYETARQTILSSGYLVGKALEETFWRTFRRETGISRNDSYLRNEIITRFVLRPWMLEFVSEIRKNGGNTAILSDQVNWLDELDVRDNFFQYFDRVYNSFHVNMSKNDPSIFEELVQWVNCAPGDIVFIDDHPGHIKRAASRGLNTILFTDRESFIRDMSVYCPGIS